jgi:hypothetical protein
MWACSLITFAFLSLSLGIKYRLRVFEDVLKKIFDVLQKDRNCLINRSLKFRSTLRQIIINFIFLSLRYKHWRAKYDNGYQRKEGTMCEMGGKHLYMTNI